MRIECTTGFTRLAHTQRIHEPDASDLVQELLRLPIRIVELDLLYPRAFDIARTLGKSKAYDALYLATAEHAAAELLTVDRTMSDNARRLGIPATLV